MKSTPISGFLVALVAVGGGCASDSRGSTGTSVPASGGTTAVGGSPASGGSGSGDSTGTGGAAASSGTSSSGGLAVGGGTGGVPPSGGTLSGGAAGTGGDAVPGGASNAGGAMSSGGTGGDAATGGAAGPGGAEPTGGAPGVEGIRTRTIDARGFTFDALEAGSDGEPVLLLHGFPDTSLEWTRLMPVLLDHGYHCLAPDQRGYSPGARPAEVDAYRYEELVADAFAFGSELGERFHVVGHDWGANVGWLMLEEDPARVASFTAISIPHYQIWARSVYEDEEMAGYLSLLNVWMAEGEGEAFWTPNAMRNMWTAKPADQTEATIAHMMEPNAMTAALNWYRASRGHQRVVEEFDVWEVNVPTLLIHGSEDLGERSVQDTAALMTGPYRVVRPDGGHFIVDEQPEVVAEETLAHLQTHPID